MLSISLSCCIALAKNSSTMLSRRGESKHLTEIFRDCGIEQDSRVGLVGYKYFYPEYYAHPERHHDVPAYLLEELQDDDVDLNNMDVVDGKIIGLF